MKKITETEYYNLMSTFDTNMNFDEIHEKWYKCFHYILRSFKVRFLDKTIHSLFYDFDMENWTALHKENTEYKDDSRKDLIKFFCIECGYISDKASYDRLFRTHWLFKNAFQYKFWNLTERKYK